VRDGIFGIVIRTVLVRPVLKPVVRLGMGYWIPEKILGGHDRPGIGRRELPRLPSTVFRRVNPSEA